MDFVFIVIFLIILLMVSLYSILISDVGSPYDNGFEDGYNGRETEEVMYLKQYDKNNYKKGYSDGRKTLIG